MAFLKQHSKIIFLFLTVILAALFAWPELNFQDTLSQGDHGRDLYAFDAVNHGQLPYKDFWWVYGPLMPYYYGLFFKIFGVHITSILLGRALLVVVCAAFFYLAASCLMSPGLAFLAATWFTQSRQEFFFTYNHIGGIAAELVICWALFSYIRCASLRYLWITLAADFILGLIKINFGLAGLAGILLSVAFIDHSKKNLFDKQKKEFYLCGALLVPLVLGLIYCLLLHDLPLYAIRQCMPYFGDDQPYHATPFLTIPYFLEQQWLTLTHFIGYCLPIYFIRLPIGIILSLILHGSTLLAAYLLISKKIEKDYRQNLLLGLGVIGVFFVFYFHEFLVSGIWYRTYWSQPFQTLFHFVMIAVALSFMPKFLRVFIFIFLAGMGILGIVSHIGSIQSEKQPYRYLSMDRGQIYVGNEPQWTDTVNHVTEFLNTKLKKDDLFFALPYDCLYYYLTGKKSPTRQLIFFNHIKVPPKQEISVIRELMDNKVSYVLMSNRFMSNDPSLGILGKTYCPLIAYYISDNFSPLVRQGGDWNQPPGWAKNHGVIIFKRK